MITNLEETQLLAETWSPEQVLQWAFQSFGSGVEMASGFGAEGMALIDIAARQSLSLPHSPSTRDFCFLRPIA